MTYYNYHAIAKNLIKNGNCFAVSIFENYHNIRPALVLYFNNHKPIPIREYMWSDYLPLINKQNIAVDNPNNIPLK